MTSNSKILSKNNLFLVSSPNHGFANNDVIDLLSTQISWELFILTLTLLVPSPFPCLPSCSGAAELCTTVQPSTIWRCNLETILIRHPRPAHFTWKSKASGANPPLDKGAAWPHKEGLGGKLQYQFYSIITTQNSPICSSIETSAVRKGERERVQGSKEKIKALHDTL